MSDKDTSVVQKPKDDDKVQVSALKVPDGTGSRATSPSVSERIKSLGMSMMGAASSNLMKCPGPKIAVAASKVLKGTQREEEFKARERSNLSSPMNARAKVLDMKQARLQENLRNLTEHQEDPSTSKEEILFDLKISRKLLTEFKEVHDQYRNDLLQDELVDEYSAEEDLATVISISLMGIEDELDQMKLQTQQQQPAPPRRNSGAPPQQHDGQRISHIRLDLPKYDGNVREWLTFMAAFRPVDESPHYDDAEKFQYLLQSLVPGSPAHKVVASYPATGSNYRRAMQDLTVKFGNTKTLIKVYVRDLLKLVVDNAKEKPNLNFIDLVTSLSSQIRNLEELGIAPARYGDLLYPVVESCIPGPMLENYMATPGSRETLPDLLSYLNAEVQRKMQSSLARAPFQDDKKGGQAGGKAGGNKGGQLTTNCFLNASEEDNRCGFCNMRNHKNPDCRRATKITLEERKEALMKSMICFKCLRGGNHNFKKCRGKFTCMKCDDNHHTLLCSGKQKPTSHSDKGSSLGGGGGDQPTESSTSPSSTGSLKSSVASDSQEVPLQLLSLIVTGENGNLKTVRALLDSGSQKSYVLESLQRELKFPVMGEEELVHQLFGGTATSAQRHQIVKLNVTGLETGTPATFDVRCISKITDPIPAPPSGPWIDEFRSKGVTFQNHAKSAPVEILIGNDVAPRLYTGRIVDLGYGPVAMETRWGWILCGKLPVPRKANSGTMSTLNITTTLVNSSISQLWDLELIGIRDEPATQTKAELTKQTEDHFLNNVTRAEGGRYEVKLPFHNGASSTLPSNYYAAERRLRSTTESLRRSGYLEQYDGLLKQWEEENMIELLRNEEMEDWRETGHYLPHRAVVKISSATTPVRPVFDASAKQRGKPSLNMCLEAGPNYLELIPSILTRFRLNQVGVTSDIRKAFQQISVAPEHRQFLKFLWWDNPSTMDKIKVYQHTRVVFGVSCSPFLLAATLKHHLSQSQPTHKQTADRLSKSLYVDNCFESLSSKTEADYFKMQSVELLEPAQFDLRGWEAGPTEAEKEIPALGLIWDMKRDQLRVDTTSAEEKMNPQLTMRTVLALAHSLFDPLGMLSPFILLAKIILRQCHEEKRGWDKPLSPQLDEDVRKWSEQIPLLKEATFPRYVRLDISHSSALHVFCDASGEAYAAAVFLRCVTPAGITITLLQSKARIATKAMRITIPRLELIGCLIGARLAATVLEDVGEPDLPVFYYSDSSTALAWIQGEGPWGVFVQNRVQEIHKKSRPDQWKHVRGKDNPADLPSRGCTARKLIDSEWWNGPEWLYGPENEWPVSSNFVPDPTAVDQEKRITVASNINVPGEPHPLQSLLKFSSFNKILRVTSYWLRYRQVLLQRVRNPSPSQIIHNPHNNNVQLPTHDEMKAAEEVILQHVQKDLDFKSMKKLRPFHRNGLVRTSTPIFVDRDENFVNPVILPDTNQFVLRLIRDIHEENCHIGTQLLLSKVRESFWVTNGRRICRRVVTKCWICRRYNARRLQVPEPPLPRARTETGVPFRVIGVDMAGPWILKKGEKVWVALFTCAVYRAIHIEVVDAMTTDEFFRAFRAFACRRGKPSVVYSDNGLNFVGAHAALRTIYTREINRFAAKKGIEWRHQPPNAPWWGGFFERMIGLVKSLLRKNMGPNKVTRKELVGLLMEVEEASNNRPLTYLSEASDDPVPITPNMMIRNSGLSYFPELDIRDAASARAAYKKIQRFREMLRSRFRSEYLGALQNRRDNGSFQPLKPGDVVLLEQDNEKRMGWPLGVIVEAICGRDGFPREYRVRTKGGIVSRAAQKLFTMELGEGDTNGAHASGPLDQEDEEN